MTVGSSALGMQSLILPLYLRSTGVKPELVGLVLGTSGLALICFEFTWGWWSDRVGVGLPLIISRFGMAAVICGYAFVQPIPGYFVLQFVGGAFSCAIGPLSWAYLASVTDARSRGDAMALAQIPASVGMGLGALIGGLMADAFGYRYVFIAASGVAFVSATIAALTFRDVRVDPRLGAGLSRPPSLATSTWFLPLAAVAAVTILAWYGASAEKGLLPILASTRGLRPSDIGLLFTLLSGLTAILVLPAARLSSRIGRKPVLLGGLAIGTIALAGYSLGGGFIALIAIVCLRAIASAATVPIAITALSVATPAQVRGRVMGMYGSLEDVGIATGPAVSGIVWSNWGLNAAFVAMAIVNAMSFVAAAALVSERKWRTLRPVTAGGIG